MMTASAPTARHQQGALLIEALVVILIFSFALMGLVGLQAKAAQLASSAEDTNRAALLANDIAARMWAQRSTTLSSATIDEWKDKLTTENDTVNGLPDGDGSVTVDADGVAAIEITWQPSASENKRRYVTHVTVN